MIVFTCQSLSLTTSFGSRIWKIKLFSSPSNEVQQDVQCPLGNWRQDIKPTEEGKATLEDTEYYPRKI